MARWIIGHVILTETENDWNGLVNGIVVAKFGNDRAAAWSWARASNVLAARQAAEAEAVSK